MKTTPPPGNDRQNAWAFFDRAYCISLASRPDRQTAARRQFEKVGLLDRVEFVTVEKHPTDNEQGIFESHLACIQKGLKADARHLLVFEDDIVFDGFSEKKLRAGISFLEANKQCRILFLGCLVTGSRRTKNPGILKVAYRSLAHAYALERSLAAELANEKWRRVPFDVMLAGLTEDKFAIYPAFAFQSNALSDNDGHRGLETFRRLFGGLGFIQKVNERYYRHRAVVIFAHLFLIAMGVWLAVH